MSLDYIFFIPFMHQQFHNIIMTSFVNHHFSPVSSSPSGDEGGLQSVVPVLAPAGLVSAEPGWLARARAAQLIVSAPWPTAVSTSHTDRETLRHQWQWLQLQRSFRGGYSGDRTCKWYKTSLSRVDTMSNRRTWLFIIMSVVWSVLCPYFIPITYSYWYHHKFECLGYSNFP